MMRLSYDPIYNSGITGLILTTIVIALLFRIMPIGVSRRRRRILLALRGVAALALVLAMLRPSFVRTDNRPDTATLAIAFDSSRSMTLASGDPSAPTDATSTAETEGISGGENRWQQQRRALESLTTGLSSLDGNLNLALYRFDSVSDQFVGGSIVEVSKSLASLQSFEPDGRQTNLSAPLESALATSRSTPLAGIVLLSDGTQTMMGETGQTIDPVSSAKWVAAIGVPLWTVALGPTALSGRNRDVAISSLPETFRMFTGNETGISFEIQTRGYEGTPIELTMMWIDDTGRQSIAATRTIVPDHDVHREPMQVPVIAPEPGQYRLIVGARSPAGETDITNDQQLSFVDVRAGGGRVLYLEGTPRLEQRYLRRALRRFPDLELTYRWIPRDTSSRWPIDLTDDLQPGQFDVIILGDLHSAAVGDEQLERIAGLVAEGTALLTLGGERAYGPGGYANTPLAKTFPVQMDEGASQRPGVMPENLSGEAGDDVLLPGQLAGPVPLRIATPHPITNIDVDASLSASEEWSALPDMPGANELAGAKVAPGVQVLLDNGTAVPMMVVGEFGQGRVASLAFDSTWIWWTSGASEFHRRFWRQLMLWLLSREESTDGELELALTRQRLSTTETSVFTATQVGGDPTASNSGSWTAEIVSDSGERRPVKISTTSKSGGGRTRTEATGEISGNAAGTRDDSGPDGLPPGIYQLQVTFDNQGSETAVAVKPFQVVDDTRELAARNADHALLDRLALMTEASGGEAFRADQIPELITRIETQRRRTERVVIEKWRLGDNPLSGWIVFALFAGCLCGEWTLRRRWGVA